MSANFAAEVKKSDEVDHTALQVVVADPLTSDLNNGANNSSNNGSKWVKFEEEDDDKFKNVSLNDDSNISNNKVRET